MFYNSKDYSWLQMIGGVVAAATVGGIVAAMGGGDIAGLVAIPFFFVGVISVLAWQKWQEWKKEKDE